MLQDWQRHRYLGLRAMKEFRQRFGWVRGEGYGYMRGGSDCFG